MNASFYKDLQLQQVAEEQIRKSSKKWTVSLVMIKCSNILNLIKSIWFNKYTVYK